MKGRSGRKQQVQLHYMTAGTFTTCFANCPKAALVFRVKLETGALLASQSSSGKRLRFETLVDIFTSVYGTMQGVQIPAQDIEHKRYPLSLAQSLDSFSPLPRDNLSNFRHLFISQTLLLCGLLLRPHVRQLL